MVLKTISPGCGVRATLMLFFTFVSPVQVKGDRPSRIDFLLRRNTAGTQLVLFVQLGYVYLRI